jgi:(p)ppGpp synthase/HD superfamily hydrolase
MKQLMQAMKICISGHQGQYDKGGEPYWTHPVWVMFHMDTVEEKIVALLHDIIEDTHWTIDRLRGCGFSETVLDAIQAITKIPGEPISKYYERVAKNSLARKVKIKDLEHNHEYLSRIL